MFREISDKQIYERFKQQQNVEYGGNFEKCEPYLLDNLSSLAICPKCLEPRGKIQLSDGKRVEQHCGCYKKAELSWGLDFNTAYETCYCCGLEIIHSGSRWSSFFCQDCQKVIRGFNEAAGSCIIPIGRHSIMNGVGFNKSAPLNEAVSVFTNEVGSLFRGIDKVREHKALILRRQLKALQLPENASLMMLTKASFLIDRKQAKTEALLSIIAHILQIPSEKAAELLLRAENKC